MAIDVPVSEGKDVRLYGNVISYLMEDKFMKKCLGSFGSSKKCFTCPNIKNCINIKASKKGEVKNG